MPRARGGTSEPSNLALACQGCNNHKYDKISARDPLSGDVVSLYHPRRDNWNEHFTWSDDYSLLVGLTPTGRATVATLQLNREGIINLRGLLLLIGLHPPPISQVDEQL